MKFFRKVIGADEEKAFANLFLEMSKLTCKSIHKLAKLLVLVVERKNIEKIVEEINKLERKVDDVRARADEEIYKGTFLPFTRADRLELLEDIDTIADIAEEIAILLRMRKFRMNSGIRELAISLERTADTLNSLLESLTKDVNKFLNLYQVMRERRRDTRGKIYGIYEELFRSKSISAIEADIIMEVLRKIMVMCRKIGNVGDRARAMIIKYL